MSLARLGLTEVEQDPNHTCQSHPHTDVIREKLKERASDPNATDDQRRQAGEMLAMMYGA
jgi:hypothetical protein